MSADVEAIRARADAATAGPWRLGAASRYDVFKDNPRVHVANCNVDTEDAAFIAAARTDVPLLCDELTEARARVAALEAEREGYREALDTIARTFTSVAPGMDAETSLRWTANDCIRTAARALSAARDAGRARGETT